MSIVAAASPLIPVVGSARADETVVACGGGSTANGPNNVFTSYTTTGIGVADTCGALGGSGLVLAQDQHTPIPPGQSSGWIATAPAGLEIAGATIPSMVVNGAVGSGYIAYFYWANGGNQRVVTSTSYSVSGIYPSSIFGSLLGAIRWDLRVPPTAGFVVNGVQLDVRETVPPTLAFNAGSLWYEGSLGNPNGTRWVWGTWPLGFSASAPSGIESMAATVNGQAADGASDPGCWGQGTGPAQTPDQTSWRQCDNSLNWTPTVTLSGAGDQTLDLSATSAAGNSSDPAGVETIHVDSQVPTVALSGPSIASSAAGTQYVTATGIAGPSGIQGLSCSVDNGPAQWYGAQRSRFPYPEWESTASRAGPRTTRTMRMGKRTGRRPPRGPSISPSQR